MLKCQVHAHAQSPQLRSMRNPATNQMESTPHFLTPYIFRFAIAESNCCVIFPSHFASPFFYFSHFEFQQRFTKSRACFSCFQFRFCCRIWPLNEMRQCINNSPPRTSFNFFSPHLLLNTLKRTVMKIDKKCIIIIIYDVSVYVDQTSVLYL